MRGRRTARVSPAPSKGSRPASEASWVEASSRAPSRLSQDQLEAQQDEVTASKGDVRIQDAGKTKGDASKNKKPSKDSSADTPREDPKI